jgi:tetratricopeptide (TPR) repeat protein
MCRVCRLALVVAVLACVAAPAGAQVLIAGSATPPELDLTPDQEQYLLDEYWTIARRYLTPESARAVREMAAWTRDRIGKVQSIQYQPERGLPTNLESKAVWDPRILRGGAMLHTEIALEALRQRSGPAFEFHAAIADGWLSLADNRKSTAGSLRARWNAALVLTLIANGESGMAERRLVRVTDQIPGEPAFLLLAGVLKETQASRMLAHGADGRPIDPEEAAAARREALAAAADDFERAANADPGLVEARVRLARVLTLQADDAKAEALLVAVLATDPAPAPSLKYVASLLLGGIRERQGRAADAARLYVEAAQTVPDGQSAYLALANVMYAVNQRDNAATVMDRWFSRGAVGAAADPWWLYPLGLDANPEKGLDDIRTEVRK